MATSTSTTLSKIIFSKQLARKDVTSKSFKLPAGSFEKICEILHLPMDQTGQTFIIGDKLDTARVYGLDVDKKSLTLRWSSFVEAAKLQFGDLLVLHCYEDEDVICLFFQYFCPRPLSLAQLQGKALPVDTSETLGSGSAARRTSDTSGSGSATQSSPSDTKGAGKQKQQQRTQRSGRKKRKPRHHH